MLDDMLNVWRSLCLGSLLLAILGKYHLWLPARELLRFFWSLRFTADISDPTTLRSASVQVSFRPKLALSRVGSLHGCEVVQSYTDRDLIIYCLRRYLDHP